MPIKEEEGTVPELNVAVTACAAVSVTPHTPVPVHAPLQPPKLAPLAGVAVNVTTVPLTYAVEQVAPQKIPAGLETTVPCPDPAVVTDRVWVGRGWKVAKTACAAVIVTRHVPVRVHAPLQPANVDPLAGAAVSATSVPLA
jgi:hypothetical protein